MSGRARDFAAFESIIREHLNAHLNASRETIEKLICYRAMIQETGEKMNLTGNLSEDALAHEQFLDSLFLLEYIDSGIKQGEPEQLSPTAELPGFSFIDIGSGAGFPGLPIAIVRPDMCVTLLDAREKRVIFLQRVIDRLALNNVTAVHGRAEELGHDPIYRERFDFAAAKAVAKMPELAELCLPFIKTGGCFLAMKSQSCDDEIQQSLELTAAIGGAPPRIADYILKNGVRRRLVIIEKKHTTPAKYARRYKEIKRGR